MQNPSMEQLAKELGVSKGLVSLALSGKYGVSEEMRTRIVLYAIQRGYDFSRRKGGNRKNVNVHTIGVLLNQDDLLAERFWPQILKGIESELYEHSIKMKVVVWDEDSDIDRTVCAIAEVKYSGLIILNKLPKEALEALTKLGCAIVVVDGKLMYEMEFDTVSANNYAGGYAGAQYLIGKGHKRLMFVGYADFSRSFKERYHGFVDGVNAAKDPAICLWESISEREGADNISDLIFNEAEFLQKVTDEETAPTAIMCANDPIAMYVVKALKKIGKKVPGDISVVGFDDIKDSAFFQPQLTTFHVPKGEMGRASVQMLLKRIQNPDKLIESAILEVTLKERCSVQKM